MTENRRYCVAMPPELEERIIEMRKSDKYCRKSISEIIRILIVKGLECEERTA